MVGSLQAPLVWGNHRKTPRTWHTTVLRAILYCSWRLCSKIPKGKRHMGPGNQAQASKDPSPWSHPAHTSFFSKRYDNMYVNQRSSSVSQHPEFLLGAFSWHIIKFQAPRRKAGRQHKPCLYSLAQGAGPVINSGNGENILSFRTPAEASQGPTS